MKSSLTFLILGCLVGLAADAQKANQALKTGNDLYRDQKYDQAVVQYNKAIVLEPPNSTASFNLANALFREGKQDEALRELNDLPAKTRDRQMRSKAYYNKGVVYTKGKKLEESIDAYKEALRQNPNDQEARENLQKALRELKKKEPPKPKEQEKKKKKEQQQQQPQKQPKMNPREAEQRLKLLEQKEKEVQERMQQEKANAGSGGAKDW